MEFTPRASWGVKFRWPDRRKNFERNTSVRGTCAEHSTKNSNYENTYPSYRNRCHAWLEFVRLGAGHDHDHHDSRDHHGSAAGGDAADNDYSEHRLLAATFRSPERAPGMGVRSFLSLPESRFRLSLLLPPG